jgi:hypothetical protein
MGQRRWGDTRTDRQFISAFMKCINEIKSIEAPYLAKPHPSPDYWAFLTLLMIMERQTKQLKLDDKEIQNFASYMLTIAASLLIEREFSNDEILEALQLDDENLIVLRKLVNKHERL